MSAKAATSGGSEPGSPGSPGVGREGTAPAGVRASGRAALIYSIQRDAGRDASWDQPGQSCSLR